MTALITIAYNQPDTLRRLFVTARHDLPVVPFIYLHSRLAAVEEACDWVISEYGGHVFKHKTNRGVARSWNDGIIAAINDGHEIVFVANDDLWFNDGDLRKMMDTAINEPEYYAYTCGGYNISIGAPVPEHGFAVFAVKSDILDTIGAFDENFFPAYNEDVDYDLRAQKTNLQKKIVHGCNVQHVGSAAIATSPMLRNQTTLTHGENDAYFFRKWGIHEDDDWNRAYKHPFANPKFHQWHIDPADRGNPYPGYGRAFGIELI